MGKISTSEELFERAKRVSPGGVHSPVRGFRGVGGTPRFIREASGVHLTDVDGNRYLDFCMAWGPMIFGHQDKEITAEVQAALKRGWSFGTAEPYSLELAELVTKNIPWVEKLRFVSSGTEAVMSAVRVARAATKRDKILKFDGCYHGHSDSFLVRAGSGLADMASPDSAGVTGSVARDTVVVPLDDLKAVEEAFAHHGGEIAAVIVEPVPANNGLLIQKDNFLKELSRIARKHGALVIFDEVITGFRTAFGGMGEVTGLNPDLVTYGKVMGGGFPVAAYGGRKDLLDLVAPAGPVYQAGTLSANPVAMCAGLAMLKKLLRDKPYAKMAAEAEWLSGQLEKTAAARGLELHVQHFASMFWLTFGRARSADGIVRTPEQAATNHKELYTRVFHALLSRGVYLAPSAFEVSFLSTAHDRSTLEGFVRSAAEAFAEVAGGAAR